MRTPKFKLNRQMHFFLLSIQFSVALPRGLLPASGYCRALFYCLNGAQFDISVLGSSRKLEEASEHLIDGSEKCICWLSFETSESACH